MAVYGNIYKFVFDSQNGSAIEIIIAKEGYTGELYVRPLGSAPILKRDNRDRIYGTSLEINAECTVPSEYAQLYTSSAYEYKVSLYRDNVLIWSGFVTPELYSEPDRPVPYDVQIVATDGLGELKFYDFYSNGMQTVRTHLTNMLQRTGINRDIILVNDLEFKSENDNSYLSSQLLDINLDLRHQNEETCYDVLQNILASFNASITMRNNAWIIFRETDFIRLASVSYINAVRVSDGAARTLPIRTFGSVDTCDWWPIGNMSTAIEPAKKSLQITAPFYYKSNILDKDFWTLGEGASYNSEEKAYVLSGLNAFIKQTVDFGGDEVGYRLKLRVNARNVGSGETEQGIGVSVKIDGVSYSGSKDYWLVASAAEDGSLSKYLWRSEEGTITLDLSLPEAWQTKDDAQEVEVIIPLYRSSSRSFVRAKNVEVVVFNPSGTYDIHVYDVVVDKREQPEGVQADVMMNNGARESAESIELGMSDGTTIPEAARITMCAIPMKDGVITQWKISGDEYGDYLSFMAHDHAKEIALPKAKYTGLLNVPRMDIPFLFLRDGVYYFPRTYSLDLYNDELDVELIAISSANVDIESSIITTVQ